MNSLPGDERREILAALTDDEAARSATTPERAATPQTGEQPHGSEPTRLVTVGVVDGPVISDPDRTGACTAGRDVAEPVGAKNLVLTHIVPCTSAGNPLGATQGGYSGRLLIIGHDMLELPL